MREVIGEGMILGDTEVDTLKAYNTATAAASQSVLARWVAGMVPGKDAHLETVMLHRAADPKRTVGFAVVLVTNEPRRVGAMRSEVLREAE